MTKFESCFRIIGALLEDDPVECAVTSVNICVDYGYDGLYSGDGMKEISKMKYSVSARDNYGAPLVMPSENRTLRLTTCHESPEAAIEAFYEYLTICLKHKREKLAKSLETAGKHVDMFVVNAGM